MKIAQQFCYEFCIAVGIMWSDKTFIFTAYTGSAASLFGGVTISKAAFLNQRKQLSVDDRNEWQDVRIVVIDEVSFMSDTILKTLDRKLKEIKNRSQPFGGFTIIFAGDFRQLEPIGVNDTELLFSSLSSQHWENCINAVIILDNEHRFKEDPEYGQMLKRMWSGDLTKDTNGMFQIEMNRFDSCNVNNSSSLYFPRRRMLCMPNKQRTKFHPSSNFPETYTSNTPKCNVQ
jgi:hypothetical protein